MLAPMDANITPAGPKFGIKKIINTIDTEIKPQFTINPSLTLPQPTNKLENTAIGGAIRAKKENNCSKIDASEYRTP